MKTEGEARGFQPSRGTLKMLKNDKNIFDRYCCINSTNHCENEESIGALNIKTDLLEPLHLTKNLSSGFLSRSNNNRVEQSQMKLTE